MDSSVVIALVWLASAMLAAVVGYCRSRSVDDALTLGAVLGPVGLVLLLASGARGRSRSEERAKLVTPPDNRHGPAGAGVSRTP
jgi:hypothetical protein